MIECEYLLNISSCWSSLCRIFFVLCSVFSTK